MDWWHVQSMWDHVFIYGHVIMFGHVIGHMMQELVRDHVMSHMIPSQVMCLLLRVI